MRDFADVPNAVGTFPDVTAIDCSGPGTTDGTADIADTLTDDWGWKQALLNDQGITPDDTAEADGDSQILDAIKLLICAKTIIPLELGQPTQHGTTSQDDWNFSAGASNDWTSDYNVGGIRFPLNLPVGLTIDLDITIRVNPGIARSGTDRIQAVLRYADYDDTSTSSSIDSEYDDGTTNAQDIVLSTTSLTVLADRSYFVQIFAGNDGASNNDLLHGLKQSVSLS